MNKRNKVMSQKRLRDLAPRALRVVERHQGSHYGFAELAPTLVKAAQAYIKLYDEAIQHRITQRAEMAQGRQSLQELAELISSYQSVLARVTPGFDARELQGTAETPDRLLSDAHRVLDVLGKASNLQHQSEISKAISVAVTQAEADWTKAQLGRANLQEAQIVVRESAIKLNRELITLRSLLRAVVGSSHVDYQTLRTSRANPEVTDDEETTVEDEATEAASTSVTPVIANGAVSGMSNGTNNGANGKTPSATATA